jgi:uncharacterized Ntn-hydrolase superfamily protein
MRHVTSGTAAALILAGCLASAGPVLAQPSSSLPDAAPSSLSSAAVLGPQADRQAPADEVDPPDPWFGTFSIIAVDPTTGEMGVGVQSRAFGAGAAVPWAKPGVGAVATQASANRLYGPKAIALLEQGLSPEDVVKRITDEDAGRDSRQVAVIDAKGRSAVYTGRRVISRNNDPNDPVHLGNYAGHVTGVNFSAQGNTLASPAVVQAMAKAYETTKGSMADRLMAALDAGQAQGGDTRGMQSAGILVVRPLDPKSDSTVERVVDIRVDDADNPFVELRRLLRMTQGEPTRLIARGNELITAGRHDDAAAAFREALAINPRLETAMYGLARAYAHLGKLSDALAQLSVAIARQPQVWRKQAASEAAFAPLKAIPAFVALIQ